MLHLKNAPDINNICNYKNGQGYPRYQHPKANKNFGKAFNAPV